jgi:hypothetical protein
LGSGLPPLDEIGLKNISRLSAIQKHCEFVNISIFGCSDIQFLRFAEKKFFTASPLTETNFGLKV